MRPQAWIYLIFVLGLVACEEETVGIKPKYQALTESVYASATIVPEDLYMVYASLPGIIEKLAIEEGDFVKKGQLLFNIEAKNSQINLDNARVNRDLAEANKTGQAALVENTKAELDAALLQLEVDSTNYFRQKRLWEQEIGAKTTLESRQLQYELSQNKVASVKKRLLQVERDLDAQYRRSQNSVRSARTTVNDYKVTSKIDGRVYQLLKNEGEFVTTQQSVASVGRADRFLIEMNIDEVDIAKISLQQKVLMTLDAYGDQVFTAKVNRIYPQKDDRTQTFLVEALFDKAPEKLYPGLNGEANIILQEQNKTLTIPLEYLSENETVYTEDGERAVKTGLKNLEFVEILSGIDTSHVLKLPE